LDAADKGKQDLISGIEEDAANEAEAIVSQAQKETAENRARAQAQAAGILEEAEQRAASQADASVKKLLSGLEVEVRRKLLQGQHRVLARVVEKVKERMRDLRAAKDEYRAVLKAWIVEAMIGLGCDQAEVSASDVDRPFIDEALLSEAAEKVGKLTGRKVKLRIAGGAERGQGVALTDSEGRIAFNNTVDTRLLRKERQIQKLVYERLFTGDRS
jgi:vacuolar-type H+-ATPase subunit E/Vma4